MNKETLKKLKELAQKATPGPWFVQYGDDSRYQYMTAISPENRRQGNTGQWQADQPLVAITFFQDTPCVNYEGDDCGDDNSAYIAAANPAAILELIDIAERSSAPVSQMTDAEVDVHIDNLLVQAGTAMRHYSMQYTKDNMRKAMRDAMASVTPPDPAVSQPQAAVDAPWRVAEFWSSANPGSKVRMLAEGISEMADWEQRGDFIRWCSPSPQGGA